MFDSEDAGPPPRHREPGDDARLPGCGCPPGYHEYGTHAPGARANRSEFPVPPGAYPVEDLAALSVGAAAMLLQRATAEAETEVVACPHILITRDTATGVVTYNGPFPTGLEALQRAHAFVDKYRGLEPRWDFTLTVAPLVPR